MTYLGNRVASQASDNGSRLIFVDNKLLIENELGIDERAHIGAGSHRKAGSVGGQRGQAFIRPPLDRKNRSTRAKLGGDRTGAAIVGDVGAGRLGRRVRVSRKHRGSGGDPGGRATACTGVART